LLFQEPVDIVRIGCLALILAGVVGLRLMPQ
jgi:multidrug transporter EmrE-like cation transporter